MERRTQEAIAAALGVSRQTVTHRVGKGIERLRAGLRKRGIDAPAALGGLLAANLCETAPSGFEASLGKLALSGSTAVSPAHSTMSLSALVTAGGLAVGKKAITSAVLALVLLTLWLGTIAELADDPADREGPSPSSPVSQLAESAPAPDSVTTPKPESAVAIGEPEPLDARSLTGTVVDAAGDPVARARVVAASPALEERAETRTDSDGRFVLVPPEAPAVSLWAFRSAAGLAALEPVSPGERRLELTLEPLCQVPGSAESRFACSGGRIATAPVPFVLNRRGVPEQGRVVVAPPNQARIKGGGSVPPLTPQGCPYRNRSRSARAIRL